MFIGTVKFYWGTFCGFAFVRHTNQSPPSTYFTFFTAYKCTNCTYAYIACLAFWFLFELQISSAIFILFCIEDYLPTVIIIPTVLTSMWICVCVEVAVREVQCHTVSPVSLSLQSLVMCPCESWNDTCTLNHCCTFTLQNTHVDLLPLCYIYSAVHLYFLFSWAHSWGANQSHD